MSGGQCTKSVAWGNLSLCVSATNHRSEVLTAVGLKHLWVTGRKCGGYLQCRLVTLSSCWGAQPPNVICSPTCTLTSTHTLTLPTLTPPPRLPRPLTHLRPGYEQFIPVPCSPHIKQGPGVVVRFNAGPVAAILQQAKGSGQGQGRGRDRARAGAGQRQRQGQGQL